MSPLKTQTKCVRHIYRLMLSHLLPCIPCIRESNCTGHFPEWNHNSLLSALCIYISRKSWCHSLRAIINEELLILMSSCAITSHRRNRRKQPRMNRLFNDFKNKKELIRVSDIQNHRSHGQKKKSNFIPLETYCWVQISCRSLLIKIKQISWNGQYTCGWQYKWQKYHLLDPFYSANVAISCGSHDFI